MHMKMTKAFFLLEIVEDNPGIKYNFPDYTITFHPIIPHRGNVELKGLNVKVDVFHDNLRKYLSRFKRKKFDPKFPRKKN